LKGYGCVMGTLRQDIKWVPNRTGRIFAPIIGKINVGNGQAPAYNRTIKVETA